MASRLIEPPQKTPFNQPRGNAPFDRDEELFNKTWWLFFGQMASAINELLEAASTSDDINTALAASQSDPTFALTGTYADIDGMAFTLPKAGVWLILASVQFDVAQDDSVAARLVVAGGAKSRFIVLRNRAAATETLMGTQAWIITSRSGDMVKVQAKILTNVTGGDDTVQDGTTLTGVFLESADSTMSDSNTALTAQQSVANFNLPGAYADIDGMALTLDKTGVWMIIASVQFSVFQDDSVAAKLVVAGVDQAGFIVVRNRAAATETLMGTQTWIVRAISGDAVTLQGEILVNVTGGDQTAEDGTTLTAVFLHS